ncbi:uncharacterized protein LOC124969302 [Sciurus carolinensis]|uniref:uncharacterized protein LOC124969302 n=1 Tax=Sciurus carolinensis TaxID=30640 RepID=UPI001FB35880|nr:uncharacterized protein LOC124969302 [Sciurus carolinensis]
MMPISFWWPEIQSPEQPRAVTARGDGGAASTDQPGAAHGPQGLRPPPGLGAGLAVGRGHGQVSQSPTRALAALALVLRLIRQQALPGQRGTHPSSHGPGTCKKAQSPRHNVAPTQCPAPGPWHLPSLLRTPAQAFLWLACSWSVELTFIGHLLWTLLFLQCWEWNPGLLAPATTQEHAAKAVNELSKPRPPKQEKSPARWPRLSTQCLGG